MKKTLLSLFMAMFFVASNILAPVQVGAAQLELGTDSNITLVPGPLSLDATPSFSFPRTYIYTEAKDALPVRIGGRVTVSDSRSSGNGWSLYVSLGAFTSKSIPSTIETLRGARLSFFNPVLTDINNKPVATSSVNSLDLIANDGVSHKFATVATSGNIGIWNINIAQAELKVIEETASSGIHRATVYWYLIDTP